MNLSDMLGHKQAAEDLSTDFMNMRKFQPTDRVSESLVSPNPQYERGIDHLIQGLVDLLPKRDGIWRRLPAAAHTIQPSSRALLTAA
jgi:hypothetical protein